MFPRNQILCLKIWKLWRAPTTLQLNIFCWHFAHIFYLPISTKWCVGLFRIFFILFRSWLVCKKIKKTWFLHTRFFTFLLITYGLNKIKKIRNTLLKTLFLILVNIRDPVNPNIVVPVKKLKIRVIDILAGVPPSILVNRVLTEVVNRSIPTVDLNSRQSVEQLIKGKVSLTFHCFVFGN